MIRDNDNDPSGSRVELENALIALVLEHGARVVMETAQELYSQTKEGKEEAAALAGAASEERWERRSEAADSRSGGPKFSKAQQDAMKALGF